ncbi:hypothetical protein JQ612_00455 [Bradyrhizobium manausense]|uniref:hypothetical protein n=1 Tax=Bradyrhizobium manausense TaxID=989370 RepID=UPI001BAC2B09|nr:hypothetical protein [Bradyrhizobium manausense]MBR0687206.1 hypothetical protein [Bradyrhizobium manausense]MBR0725843.1 hypothetical protein [Bradyrhizobium manausense]MBR0831647.1 hypothetical protein [Bradyrhizobium manausense]
MADRLVRISSSPRAVPFPDRSRATTIEPMLPALLRGVIFISVLSAPFVAALLAG